MLYLRCRSVRIFRAESAASFTPLDGNVQTTHVHIVQVLLSFLSISVIVILDEGIRALYNKDRKLKYTLQIIEESGSKVGVNTHFTNKIVNHALQNNLIDVFSKKVIITSEKKFGENTRCSV